MHEYIVLLRGINISGKNKISMSELKKYLELMNYTDVKTYLNSGNIIIKSIISSESIIASNINKMISEKFLINVPVYFISSDKLKDILLNAPDWWKNKSKEYYYNIIFIIPPMNITSILTSLGDVNQSYEKIQIYNDVIFWMYELKNYRKTNWWSKSASIDERDSITIRTGNTITKLMTMCNVK